MKLLRPTFILIVVQLALLKVELLTSYDTSQRQLALAVTNIVSTLAVLLVDRWLRRRSSGSSSRGLSLITFLFVAAAVWLDALGNFQHLYAAHWWWDRLSHTVGGMALSAAFIDLFLAGRRSGRLAASSSISIWLGFLVGQLLGSLYEISEWLGDMWFKTERVRGQYDTPHDLFQNLLGGAIVLLLFLSQRKKSQ